MTNGSGEERELTLRPIGYVRTGSRFKFNSPHQPNPDSEEVNEIELLPDRQFELALQDLEGFNKIWLVAWFNQNKNWRPRVLPPRGPARRRGVFATRSPHRPNPIGLTCVTLFEVSGRFLKVGALDLTDGTPILDIKPYLTTVDCHPEGQLGWVSEIEQLESTRTPFQITTDPLAEEQLNWLKECNVDFTERAFGILTRDPTPHRTRRILQIEENLYRIACGPWRMYYRIEGQRIVIVEITSGYSEQTISSEANRHDRDTHLAFQAKWPSNLATNPRKWSNPQ